MTSVIILLHMFYVLLFWTSLKDVVTAREKARGDTNGLLLLLFFHLRAHNQHVDYSGTYNRPLADINQKTKNGKRRRLKNKTGITGSFVVAYFQPAASIDRLHLALTSRTGSRETK